MKIGECVNDLRNQVLPLKGHYFHFCNRTGVDYSWLMKFTKGRLNPTQASLERLERALDDWREIVGSESEIPTPPG